jgi:plasmid stabilization system protein ParE
MKIIFSSLAKLELEDAIAYYELELRGLGINFKEEIRKNINRIKKFPQAASVERGEIRKSLLHKFPYKILYSIEADHIFIIALAHQHRKPDYWVDRKSDE